MQQWISREFSNEVNYLPHIDNEIGILDLVIKDSTIGVKIKSHEVTHISKLVPLHTQAVYLDSPFDIDELSRITEDLYMRRRRFVDFWESRIYNHKDHLIQRLREKKSQDDVEQVMGDILVDQRMNKILKKISEACDGEMELRGLARLSFRYIGKSGVEINLANLSTGMKTFVAIKQLLQNESLEEKGVLILDEPEVHLHPEWQILFAEVIVLLQKEYDMHILLTTHSPYFLHAIEVYSAKHRIADRCRYYLAENVGERAQIKNVTRATELVYNKLLRPFEILKAEEYRDS